jgi:hypothetical protein
VGGLRLRKSFGVRVMSFTKSLLTLALAAAPMLVCAGGTAQIQGGDKNITLEFDGPFARVQTDQQKNVHLVARDNKVYAVTDMGGRPLVVESGAVIGLLGAQGMAKLENDKDAIQKFVSLDPTGRNETVAGFQGAVYKLVYTDGNGKRRSEEAVLGKQPSIVELSQSLGHVAINLMRLAKHDTQGSTELVNELQKRNLGLLRFGAKLRLISLNTATPNASRFVLPASPMDMSQGLGGLLQGMGQK